MVTAINGATIVGGTVIDSNGNELTTGGSGSTTTFTDTLGNTALSVDVVSASETTYSYTAPSGGTAKYTVNYTNYTVATDFGVSGVAEYAPTANELVTSIDLPDGTAYQFTYEKTPGTCTPLEDTYKTNCVTARIASVSLPTGGTITYTYTGGTNGIEPDGTTSGFNRTLNPGGEWQYSRGVSDNVTYVYDPNLNSANVTFSGNYEIYRQVYNSSSSLLLTKTTCYNLNYTNCNSATVGTPITQIDAYTQPAGGGTRLSQTTFTANGLLTDDKEYNYGALTGQAPGTTNLIRETAISYGSYNGSGCTALGNSISNKPCQVIVYDWSSGKAVTIASTSYTYDQGSVTSTSGTPQHISISGSRGNLTTLAMSTGSTTLSKTFSYYDTGNINVATDVNSAQTTFVYGSGSCGNSFATTVDEPLSLTRSITWNCTGGVLTQLTDENGNTETTNYTDPDFWRPASTIDLAGIQTNIAYYTNPTAVETAMQGLNGGNSAWDFRTTVDGFGRPDFSQQLQAPGGTTYDTWETDYNNLGQPNVSRMPYSAAASPSSDNTSAPGVTTTYDALGRVLTATDADKGEISYSYTAGPTAMDVLQTTSGGQTFEKQFEYDGLGRLTSVCEINLSGNLPNTGTCGQNTTQKGYWTKYTYDALGHLLTVTQNAQATSGQQTRAFTYDLLGRMLTESNPETSNTGQNGTTTYVYDTYGGTCALNPFPGTAGDLVLVAQPSGWTCYLYDQLHRVTDVGTSVPGAVNPCRRFRYDNSAGYAGSTKPTGLANMLGRLAEAATDTCISTSSDTLLTDEWFSYGPRGPVQWEWELTPNSGGYYKMGMAVNDNFAPWNVSLSNSSGTALFPTMLYSLNSEGRLYSVTASPEPNPVTSVTYSTSSTTNPLGALTNVTFGSGDSDAFTYDPNTGRMKTYTYSVDGATDSGALTWNPNGTLTQLAITDNISGTSDSQTCNYLYDDLSRVSQASCTPAPVWGQSFSYDAFGNVTKNTLSGENGLTFAPTYNTANQFSSIPGVTVSYGPDGRLLTDNLNSYTWDVYGDMSTVSTGSATITSTYDALGRMVENNAGGIYNQFIYYGQSETKLAKCNGQTLVKAFVTLPGGATAVYNSSGLAYFRHSDWIGSSRLTSTATSPTSMAFSAAYAPFGEQYQNAGTADASFTGQDQDTASSLYDFIARRQSPSQGRWLSPDPAGLAAVDPTNPQTWNRYAYVTNNPLANVDPSGLLCPGCGVNLPGNRQVGPGYLYGPGTGYDEFDFMALVVDVSQFDPGPTGEDWVPVGAGDTDLPAGSLYNTETDEIWSPGGFLTLLDFSGTAVSANNGPLDPTCGITVKCRGIQTDNLGKIGMQHCDAQVTDSSGAVWSLSGGPQANYMSITALNAWATSPPTEPFTGTTVYQGNSCSAAGCMIQSTQAWNQDIVKPAYSPVFGPNSNTWLKGTAASCGVSLSINAWGSIW